MEVWSQLRTYKTTGRLSSLHSHLNLLQEKGVHCLAILTVDGLGPADRCGPSAIHRPWAVKCVLRASSSSEVAPSQATVALHTVHCAVGPAPASVPAVKPHTGSGHHLGRERVCKLGFPFAESKTVTEKAALGSLLHLTFPLTSSVIKAVKDQGRGDGKLIFVLAVNILLLQMGIGPHLLAEVIFGLHGAPNPICGQRYCCFWKAILVAKCLVKMQSSSQTKDLIKDHFSFTASFYNHCSVWYPQ